MKKYLKTGLIFLSLSLTIFTAGSCLAVSSLVDTSNSGYATGNYSLNDVRDYAIYIMRLILSLVGTVSLLMFVYGGITFLTSAGNQTTIKKGMEILKAAVIGIVLVFSSVLIINLFFGGLGVTWNPTTGAVTSK
jgi:hypothetical protein